MAKIYFLGKENVFDPNLAGLGYSSWLVTWEGRRERYYLMYKNISTLVSHQDPEKHKRNARASKTSRPLFAAKITIYILEYWGFGKNYVEAFFEGIFWLSRALAVFCHISSGIF